MLEFAFASTGCPINPAIGAPRTLRILTAASLMPGTHHTYVQVVMSYNQSYDPPLLDSILGALAKASLYERAGELYEFLKRSEEALQAYRRGHAYRWGTRCNSRCGVSMVCI
jgi:hypothetical protein